MYIRSSEILYKLIWYPIYTTSECARFEQTTTCANCVSYSASIFARDSTGVCEGCPYVLFGGSILNGFVATERVRVCIEKPNAEIGNNIKTKTLTITSTTTTTNDEDEDDNTKHVSY